MRFGIRAWRVDKEGHLISTNFDYVWSMGPLLAMHEPKSAVVNGTHPDHSIDKCPAQSCGFYSYSSWEAAEASGYIKGQPRVLGVILIGGKVLPAKVDAVKHALQGEHWRYRSEKAMLVALCDEVTNPVTAIVPYCGVPTSYPPTKPCPELYPVPRISRAELKAFIAIEMADPGAYGVM